MIPLVDRSNFDKAVVQKAKTGIFCAQIRPAEPAEKDGA